MSNHWKKARSSYIVGDISLGWCPLFVVSSRVNLSRVCVRVVSGLFPPWHHEMQKKNSKRQSLSKARAARQQARRFPFTPKTTLYNLVAAKYHMTLAAWLQFISPYLECDKVPDWKRANRLVFRCSNNRIVWCLAILKIKIGKEGFKCKWSVFIRYITSKEHSNITIREDILISLINSIIRLGLPTVN